MLNYDGTTGAILRWYPPGGVEDVVAGARQTFIPDIQGSNIGLLSSSGTLTKIGYLPFGENPALTTDGMRYTGQQLDSETAGSTSQPSGLYYLRARQYSPAWGRFLTPDPAKSGTNMYAYTGNDPLNRTDPSGEVEMQDGVDQSFYAALYGALSTPQGYNAVWASWSVIDPGVGHPGRVHGFL